MRSSVIDLALEKPRLQRLLDRFSEVADPREPWREAHPLPEVLLLVVCGSIASCDDFDDDIAAWGKAHLPFLRRFLPTSTTCRASGGSTPDNRIDPQLFSACFMAWASELRPDASALLALDGKTSRRTHDRRRQGGPAPGLGLRHAQSDGAGPGGGGGQVQ
jgi:hypothetical protein